MFTWVKPPSLQAKPQLAPKADLPSLPLELISAIWQHLDLRDRIVLTSCCRRLRELNSCRELWGNLTIPVPGRSDDPAARSSTPAQARDKFSLKLWGFVFACHRALGARSGVISRLISRLIRGLISRMGLWLDGSSRQQLGAAAVHASLAAWLWSHLAGLRQLRLDFDTHMDGRQPDRRRGQVVCCLPPLRVTAALAGAQLEVLALNNSLGIQCDAGPVLAPLRALSPTLTCLNITNCELRSLAAVGEALGPAGRLLELGLSGNKLAWGDERTFEALTALTQLTRLDISANCLEGLPQQLSALRRLAELDASSNGLVDEWNSAFAPLAWLGASLTQLDLGGCGIDRLPRELSSLSRLQDLGLAHCRGLNFYVDLAEWGVAAWEPLASLQSLTRLDLRGCRLPQLPSELEQLPQLQHLDLSGNHVSSHPLGAGGASGGSIGSYATLLCMPALRHLGVCGCMVDGIPVQLLHVTVLHTGVDGCGPPAAVVSEEEGQG